MLKREVDKRNKERGKIRERVGKGYESFDILKDI